MISMIAAVSASGVIGAGGGIPWNIPEDMAHFREVTTGSPVIMGRRTYESIGRPLPGRYNIVVTSGSVPAESAASLEEAIEKARKAADSDEWRSEIFLIGGGRIYAEGMGIADRIYLTELYDDYPGDTYFPEIDPAVFSLTSFQDRPELRLRFCVYDRKAGDVC
ncbi:MAG: dihydrofolate reductase [Ruminococcus sp.]|nr:dihydrofolate reductase [Ruminococcus sp.]